jgi:hypothetical protein
VSLWFVTPAYRRFNLSAVCFDQRAGVIEALRQAGVEAHQVVIGDDANLDIARRFGFATVERDNQWLDTKFNDGMQYAGEHGAEWIVPIGSDSWIDPAYFLPLPDPSETRTSPIYCAVEQERMAELWVGRGSGAGPYMFHRSLLEPSGFRPAGDGQRNRGIDGATITGIGVPINWRQQNLHQFQYIGFRGTPHITPYAKLLRWVINERGKSTWPQIAARYGQDLVERVREALAADAIS